MSIHQVQSLPLFCNSFSIFNVENMSSQKECSLNGNHHNGNIVYACYRLNIVNGCGVTPQNQISCMNLFIRLELSSFYFCLTGLLRVVIFKTSFVALVFFFFRFFFYFAHQFIKKLKLLPLHSFHSDSFFAFFCNGFCS